MFLNNFIFLCLRPLQLYKQMGKVEQFMGVIIPIKEIKDYKW